MLVIFKPVLIKNQQSWIDWNLYLKYMCHIFLFRVYKKGIMFICFFRFSQLDWECYWRHWGTKWFFAPSARARKYFRMWLVFCHYHVICWYVVYFIVMWLLNNVGIYIFSLGILMTRISNEILSVNAVYNLVW